ncbi:MAG: tetratricopeptide repeat protein [Desulfobacterales bacterium]|nr:tetratricopeptide repeat protein [Desulfobacterales bacterium]
MNQADRLWLIFILVCSISLTGMPTGVSGSDVNDLIFKGADFHYKGELEQAVTQFEKAAVIEPNNEYVHNQLGILYAKQEQFKAASDEFQRVIEIDGKNTYALLWTGILDLKQGNLNRAFDTFGRIVEIDPNNANAYYFLGSIYNFRHNPIKAIEYLKKARDADSGEPDTHYRLGKSFHNLDMHSNALLEYQRTLSLNPRYGKAINEIGWICYNQGDTDRAIGQWEESLMINPKDRDAVFNLTRAYNDIAFEAMSGGNQKKAVSCWKKTLHLNPKNKAALHHLKALSNN